ncbi:putative polyketide biosynthesis zinc-dependent hydrolase BaeB [Candidatus Entotheonellaceae bacterium PAL068K]
MIFEQIDAGGDRNYSYLIGDEQNRVCAVVDPGYDTSKLEARVKELGFAVTHIFNTHTHHDHIAGNDVFHKGDVKLAAYKEAKVNPDVPLDQGDEVWVGNIAVKILFTPGHYLDSICLLAEDKLITGDTLFVGCIGGTGFGGSSAEKQFHSLFQVILKLDDAVEIYPGHDYGETPTSTVGYERTNNPFLQRTNFDDFVWLKEHWEEYKAEHGIP